LEGVDSDAGDLAFFATGAASGVPSCGGFRPFCSFDVELLFLLAIPFCRLRLLEWISIHHVCCAKEITRLRWSVVVVCKDFWVVVVQDVIVEDVVTAGFALKKRVCEGEIVLVSGVPLDNPPCNRGLLQEKARLEVSENANLGPDGFRSGNDCESKKARAGSRTWEHSLWVIFEDILSRSS